MDIFSNPEKYRVISTARTIESMNEAEKNGHRLVFVQVKPSPKIKAKYAVVRDIHTKEISQIHDYRLWDTKKHEILIDWTFTYPYQFPLPFAAYIVPADVAIGEKVFLEDLIEDFPGRKWNQGDQFRLRSCAAIWDGEKMNVLYDPKRYRTIALG